MPRHPHGRSIHVCSCGSVVASESTTPGSDPCRDGAGRPTQPSVLIDTTCWSVGSELGRQIAVDLKADADFYEGWCFPTSWSFFLGPCCWRHRFNHSVPTSARALRLYWGRRRRKSKRNRAAEVPPTGSHAFDQIAERAGIAPCFIFRTSCGVRCPLTPALVWGPALEGGAFHFTAHIEPHRRRHVRPFTATGSRGSAGRRMTMAVAFPTPGGAAKKETPGRGRSGLLSVGLFWPDVGV
jgi:hypothetical protein